MPSDPGANRGGKRPGREPRGELGDGPARRDPPDRLGRALVAEPQVPVGAWGDRNRFRARVQARAEQRDCAGSGALADRGRATVAHRGDCAGTTRGGGGTCHERQVGACERPLEGDRDPINPSESEIPGSTFRFESCFEEFCEFFFVVRDRIRGSSGAASGEVAQRVGVAILEPTPGDFLLVVAGFDGQPEVPVFATHDGLDRPVVQAGAELGDGARRGDPPERLGRAVVRKPDASSSRLRPWSSTFPTAEP